MKQTSLHNRFCIAAAAFALVASVHRTHAYIPGDITLVNNFNTTNQVTAYFHEYADAYFTNVFSTDDALGDASSGSMLLEEKFAATHPQGALRYNLAAPIPTGPGAAITNLQFDVKVDAGSAVDQFGDATYFQLAIRDQGGNYVGAFGGNIRPVGTNNGWRHITFNNGGNALFPGTVTSVNGIMIDPYSGNYTNVAQGPLTLIYIDNIKFMSQIPANTIVVVHQFDNSAGGDETTNAYHLDYGSAGLSPGGLGATNGTVFSQDDANGDPNSGSMLIMEAYGTGFPNGSYRWDNAAVFPFTPLTDANLYTNLSFDLKVDSTSAVDQFGTASFFQFAIRDQGYSYVGLYGGNLNKTTANNGWQHVVVYNNGNVLGPLAANTLLQAIQLDPYDSNYTNAQDTNSITKMYIDNVYFRKPGPGVVIPPPVVTIEKASQGLNMFAGSTGGFDRQNIRTLLNSGTLPVGNYWSWVGNGATPVVYTFTISEYPNVNGFQFHMFFTPGTPTENAPDYNEANCLMMDLQLQGGGGSWTFRYKTNQPNANGQLYGSGQIANINDPAGVVGTWTLQFVNNTSVTMTSPHGVSTNFTIDANVASAFADPISIFYGIQPNSAGGVGLKAVLTDVTVAGIAGNGGTYEDDFSADSTLDTATQWVLAAVANNSLMVVQPAANPYWVNWTLPATGFVMQTNANLANVAGWSTNGLPGPITIGSGLRTLLTPDNLPGAQTGFFRVAKPGY